MQFHCRDCDPAYTQAAVARSPSVRDRRSICRGRRRGGRREGKKTMVRIAFDKEQVLSGHLLLRHLSREELRRLATTTTLSNHSPGAVSFPKGRPRRQHDGRDRRPSEDLLAFGRGQGTGSQHRQPRRPVRRDSPARRRAADRRCDRARGDRSSRPRAIEVPAAPAGEPRSRAPPVGGYLQAPARDQRAPRRHAFPRGAVAPRALPLRLSQAFGKTVEGGTLLDIKLSQQQLGSYVGVSRESVNKHLGGWQRDGLITVTGGIITLRNKQALEDVALAEA